MTTELLTEPQPAPFTQNMSNRMADKLLNLMSEPQTTQRLRIISEYARIQWYLDQV